MRLLVYGSGFSRPSYFKTDADELRCGKPKEVGGDEKCEWSPSSLDFTELVRKSGGGQPAKDVAELLQVLDGQKPASIDELRIIGHSNNQFFALGGTIIKDNVTFNEPAMLGVSATFLTAKPRFRQLRDRFAPKGRVVLMGCGSGGTDGNLLHLVSLTFMLAVSGFQRPIQYAIDGVTGGRFVKLRDGSTTRFIANDAKITERGKAMYSSAGLQIEEVLGADAVDRAALGSNAWDLRPDSESRSGQSLLNAVGRAKSDRISAMELGYRVINEFHSSRADLVHGVGYEPNMPGLRVAFEGSKSTLYVGKAFVDNTSPTTIEKRAAEMGAALDLIAVHKPGIIPMRP